MQLFISRYQCKRSIFLFTNKILNIKVVSIIFKNIFQNLMIIMYFIFSAYMICIELQSSQYIFLSLGQVENLFLYICLCFKTTLQQVLSVKSGLVLGTASGGWRGRQCLPQSLRAGRVRTAQLHCSCSAAIPDTG